MKRTILGEIDLHMHICNRGFNTFFVVVYVLIKYVIICRFTSVMRYDHSNEAICNTQFLIQHNFILIVDHPPKI
jgi:hypothetical protein